MPCAARPEAASQADAEAARLTTARAKATGRRGRAVTADDYHAVDNAGCGGASGCSASSPSSCAASRETTLTVASVIDEARIQARRDRAGGGSGPRARPHQAREGRRPVEGAPGAARRARRLRRLTRRARYSHRLHLKIAYRPTPSPSMSASAKG